MFFSVCTSICMYIDIYLVFNFLCHTRLRAFPKKHHFIVTQSNWWQQVLFMQDPSFFVEAVFYWGMRGTEVKHGACWLHPASSRATNQHSSSSSWCRRKKHCFKQFAFELVSRISKGRGNQQNSVKQRHHLWLHLYYKHGFNPAYHCCHVRCDQKIRISFFVWTDSNTLFHEKPGYD